MGQRKIAVLSGVFLLLLTVAAGLSTAGPGWAGGLIPLLSPKQAVSVRWQQQIADLRLAKLSVDGVTVMAITGKPQQDEEASLYDLTGNLVNRQALPWVEGNFVPVRGGWVFFHPSLGGLEFWDQQGKKAKTESLAGKIPLLAPLSEQGVVFVLEGFEGKLTLHTWLPGKGSQKKAALLPGIPLALTAGAGSYALSMVKTGEGLDNLLIVYDLEGRELWRVSRKNTPSPYIRIAGQDLYVIGGGKSVAAYNRQGQLRWQSNLKEPLQQMECLADGVTAAVLGGATNNGTLLLLSPDGKTVREITLPRPAGKLSPGKGERLFVPVGRELWALSSAGEVLWKHKMPAEIDGVTYAGGNLLLRAGDTVTLLSGEDR